jgi:hypothetical protein
MAKGESCDWGASERTQRKTKLTAAEGKQADGSVGKAQRADALVLGVVENEARQARAAACRAQAQGRTLQTAGRERVESRSMIVLELEAARSSAGQSLSQALPIARCMLTFAGSGYRSSSHFT